jgi:GNAT superfamily N-acetyltransferase
MIVIRRTTENDASDLTRIVSENYSRAFAEIFASELDGALSPFPNGPHFYTAVMDDRVAGCACYAPSWISWGTFSIGWVNADKDVRNHGIGRALVSKCISDIKNIGTLVTISTSVPEFYKKNWDFKHLQDFSGNEGDTYALMSLSLA